MAERKDRSSSKQAQEFARRAHLLGHDLRNPIGSILGYVDLLRDMAGSKLDEEQHDFLGRIEANCNEMLRELVRFTETSDRQAEED